MLALLVLSIAGALLTGCGSSSTSTAASSTSASGSSTAGVAGKPAYCSAISDLENAIKALPATSTLKNGASGLESAFSRVQTDADALVADVKSDFASETSALKSSLDALSSTVKKVTSSPTAATVSQLPVHVAAVSGAAKDLASATAPKCS